MTIFYEIPKKLEQLVSYLTKDYDESHNIIHHLAVYFNCIKIYENTPNIRDILDSHYFNIIKLSAMLHDTVDHKYPFVCVKKEIIKSFLKTNYIEYYEDVLTIIDNISYSKEIKNGYPKLKNEKLQLVRDIVSDADKLEALGEIGIKRCIEFSKLNNPHFDNDLLIKCVIKHAKEKLIKLKDEFIRTEHGKKLAEEPHNFVVKFIEDNDKNLI